MGKTDTGKKEVDIAKCIQGDRKAQFDLYHAFSGAMYNTCLRMLQNRMDAEDALQNAFVRIFHHIQHLRGDATLGAWIRQIVVRQCIDKLRERNDKPGEIAFPEWSDSEVFGLVEETLTTHWNEKPSRIPEILQAIAGLPDGYRTVLNLYLIEGYDHEEIATILGITTATSKSQYSRAKQKLRQKLTS